MEARLTTLEEQLRELTGKVEENANAVMRVQRVLSDVQVHLGDLDKATSGHAAAGAAPMADANSGAVGGLAASAPPPPRDRTASADAGRRPWPPEAHAPVALPATIIIPAQR